MYWAHGVRAVRAESIDVAPTKRWISQCKSSGTTDPVRLPPEKPSQSEGGRAKRIAQHTRDELRHAGPFAPVPLRATTMAGGRCAARHPSEQRQEPLGPARGHRQAPRPCWSLGRRRSGGGGER